MEIKDNLDRSSYLPVKITGDIQQEIVALSAGHLNLRVVDTYAEQLEEILLLRNPQYRFDKNYQDHLKSFIGENKNEGSLITAGHWFYFPWLDAVVHYLPEQMHFEMRTGRNKLLITAEEQEKYYNSTIGILGMSVGSHVALTITMTGGSKNLRIADPDIISGSNLNRIRTGVPNIATSKVVVVARQIYEINPYVNLTCYHEGLSESNFEGFLSGLDCLVEEMDNPYFKIKVRYAAKEKHIPVIMGTDNGDNIFVDIERFDLDNNLSILNGLIGDMTAEDLKNLDPKDLPRTAAKIAGANLATLRMQQSVLLVGKGLYSWPQLGTAANLCGSALAYLARRIVLKSSNIASGRFEVNLDSIFESDYTEQTEHRENETKKFLKMIGLE